MRRWPSGEQGVTGSLQGALPGAVEYHLIVQVPHGFSAPLPQSQTIPQDTPRDEFRFRSLYLKEVRKKTRTS